VLPPACRHAIAATEGANSLGLPCILLPTPDILLFEPSGQFHLPLPAIVRPLTFFAQGVTVSQLGLLSTDGFVVSAL